MYSLNHNQATNPPAPNYYFHRCWAPQRTWSGPCPRSGHSWEQLSSDPRTLLLSLPLPHPGSAPLGGGGGGGAPCWDSDGPLCGHMVQHRGRTGYQAVWDSRQTRCTHSCMICGACGAFFLDFSSPDLSAISCACSWCPVWRPACQATLDQCTHQPLVGGAGWHLPPHLIAREGAQT